MLEDVDPSEKAYPAALPSEAYPAAGFDSLEDCCVECGSEDLRALHEDDESPRPTEPRKDLSENLRSKDFSEIASCCAALEAHLAESTQLGEEEQRKPKHSPAKPAETCPFVRPGAGRTPVEVQHPREMRQGKEAAKTNKKGMRQTQNPPVKHSAKASAATPSSSRTATKPDTSRRAVPAMRTSSAEPRTRPASSGRKVLPRAKSAPAKTLGVTGQRAAGKSCGGKMAQTKTTTARTSPRLSSHARPASAAPKAAPRSSSQAAKASRGKGPSRSQPVFDRKGPEEKEDAAEEEMPASLDGAELDPTRMQVPFAVVTVKAKAKPAPERSKRVQQRSTHWRPCS